MKKFAILMFVFFSLLSCGSGKNVLNGEEEKILKVLPSSPVFFLRLSTFKAFSDLLDQEKSDFLKEKIKTMPFKISDLKECGIEKEVAIAFSDLNFSSGNLGNAIAYFHSKKPKRVLQKLSKILKKPISKSGYFYFRKSGTNYLFLSKKNYFVILFSEKFGKDELVKSSNNENNIDLGDLKEVSGNLKSKDLLVYLNAKNLKDSKEVAALTKSFDSLGIGFDFNSKDLSISFYVKMGKNSIDRVLTDGVEIDNSIFLSIPKKPIFLVSYGLNFSQLLKYMKKTKKPEFKNMDMYLKMTGVQMGIDFKKDIIENMQGCINMGVFDSKSFSIEKMNAFMSMKFRRIKPIKKVLKKLYLLSRLKPGLMSKETENEKSYYKVKIRNFSLFIFTKGDYLIVTLGKDMMKDLISGEGSIILPSEIKSKLSNSNKKIGYANIPSFMKFIRNISPQLAFLDNSFVNGLKYIFSERESKGYSAKGEAILKTNFKNTFLKELSDFIFEQIKKEEN